ncbi:hypothetical protein ACWD3I_19540 [Streptomyces sp. NPDC002817]|uniref:hypothetical protein n=1 Tax=Streptomyces sp. NPDC088357 TaxID=3154655 RepID=UPI00341C930A
MRNTAIWSAVVAGAATASVLGLAGEASGAPRTPVAATNGSDSAAGTLAQPPRTPRKALDPAAQRGERRGQVLKERP